jgi:hypothetical protein
MVRGPAAWRVRNRRLREVTIARVLGPVKSNPCCLLFAQFETPQRQRKDVMRTALFSIAYLV